MSHHSEKYHFRCLLGRKLVWKSDHNTIRYTLTNAMYDNFLKCMRITSQRLGYTYRYDVVYFLNYKFWIDCGVVKWCCGDWSYHCWIDGSFSRSTCKANLTFCRINTRKIIFYGSINRMCRDPTIYTFKYDCKIYTFQTIRRKAIFSVNGLEAHVFRNLLIFKVVSEPSHTTRECILNLGGDYYYFDIYTFNIRPVESTHLRNYKTWHGGDVFNDITVSVGNNKHLFVNSCRSSLIVKRYKFVPNGILIKSDDKLFYMCVILPWGKNGGYTIVKQNITQRQYNLDTDFDYFCYNSCRKGCFHVRKCSYTKITPLPEGQGEKMVAYSLEDGYLLYVTPDYNFVVNPDNDQITTVAGVSKDALVGHEPIMVNIDFEGMSFSNVNNNNVRVSNDTDTANTSTQTLDSGNDPNSNSDSD